MSDRPPLNSTTRTSGGGNSAHEERSRQTLITAAKAINSKGHDVLDAEGKVVNKQAAIQEHTDKSPDLVKVHGSVVTKYYIYLFALACVYCLDVLLFGATAEYVVSLITGNWVLVIIGKYAIPLAFLGIEVLCSLKMTEARPARDEEEAPSARRQSMTVAERVRRALRAAKSEEPGRDADRKLHVLCSDRAVLRRLELRDRRSNGPKPV
jgi:hypothetical protein